MRNWPGNGMKYMAAALVGTGAGISFLFFLPIISGSPLFMGACLVGSVLAVIFFIKPELCFLLMLLLRSSLDPILQRTKLEGGQLGFGAVLNGFVILMAIVFYARKPAALRRMPMRKVWMFFLIVMGCSVFYSVDRSSAVKLFSNFVSYFAVFTIPFFLIETKQEGRFWLKVSPFHSLFPFFWPCTVLSGEERFWRTEKCV